MFEIIPHHKQGIQRTFLSLKPDNIVRVGRKTVVNVLSYI